MRISTNRLYMHMERSKKPESINNSRQEKTNMKTDTLELSSSKSVKGLNKDVIANIIAFAKEDAKKAYIRLTNL